MVGFGQFKVISDGLLVMINLLVSGDGPKNRAWVFLPFSDMVHATHKEVPDCPDTLFLHMKPNTDLNFSWCDVDALFVSLVVCNRKS